MPSYQQTTAARDRAKRIREVHNGFRRERVTRREDAETIRLVLKFGTESEAS
jgi:hypothetical protein